MRPSLRVPVKGTNFDLGHGDVVIAAITSCTNTSNPSVMVAAGLLAKNAVERGLRVKPWVKTSLAPGSQVVTDYLAEAGLTKPLDALGFNLVGYGCTTCIGNSGPLPEEISHAVHTHHLAVAAVLSGNRNFEGRVNHDVRANYLASPPLVVAYALAGSLAVDLTKDPLGTGADGAPVYLKDIWPKAKEIAEVVRKAVKKSMFEKRYGDVFRGDPEWRAIEMAGGLTYDWEPNSTYMRNPPYFAGMGLNARAGDRHRGCAHSRPLSRFDHDRPHLARWRDQARQPRRPLPDRARRRRSRFQFLRRAARQSRSDGARHLRQYQDQEPDGARASRAASRSTIPSGERLAIYDAAMRYHDEGVPLVVFAGKEYGTGSSRDWAAKGTLLLGVRAVIAESFERIHRSNLIGMGVLPLLFAEGESWRSLGLKGDERVSIEGLAALKPMQTVEADDCLGRRREARGSP